MNTWLKVWTQTISNQRQKGDKSWIFAVIYSLKGCPVDHPPSPVELYPILRTYLEMCLNFFTSCSQLVQYFPLGQKIFVFLSRQNQDSSCSWFTICSSQQWRSSCLFIVVNPCRESEQWRTKCFVMSTARQSISCVILFNCSTLPCSLHKKYLQVRARTLPRTNLSRKLQNCHHQHHWHPHGWRQTHFLLIMTGASGGFAGRRDWE